MDDISNFDPNVKNDISPKWKKKTACRCILNLGDLFTIFDLCSLCRIPNVFCSNVLEYFKASSQDKALWFKNSVLLSLAKASQFVSWSWNQCVFMWSLKSLTSVEKNEALSLPVAPIKLRILSLKWIQNACYWLVIRISS